MICVLYKPCLLLALTDRQQSSYVVVAAIALSNSSIEEPDNGRGNWRSALDLSAC